MKLSMIVAMSRNGFIGKDGGLPWDRIPEDMANFRRLTMGHGVIMGRKTWQSLDAPLDGRKNIVLSRDRNLTADEYHGPHRIAIVRTPAEAIVEAFDQHGDEEAFVIGGESIYRLFAPMCDEMHVTIVDQVVVGDARFELAWTGQNDCWDIDSEKRLADGVMYEHWIRRF